MLKHCKTDKMVADYFTKPLQGSLFKVIRNYIMGISEIPIEERVGKTKKEQHIETKNGAIVTQNVTKTVKLHKTYVQALAGVRTKDDKKG